MQIVNHTRLSAALTFAFDHDAAEVLCVAVKGTFTLPVDGDVVRLADEQAPLLYGDEYWGDPSDSSIRYPADLIPGKAATDVLLTGTARSPTVTPVQRLEASVRVGPVFKRVVVSGDRYWQKRSLGGGFVISEPTYFTEMPLVYERAFGGVDRTSENESEHEWDARNPVGVGFRVNRDAVDGTPVPNIEDPASPMTSWRDRPPVAGFGAIGVAWEPRSIFAGTYDDAWLNTRAPLLPADVQPQFFSAAPAGLMADGFLESGESVELVNVSETSRLSFRLPAIDVLLTPHIGRSAKTHRAHLWTVLFVPDEHRFCMVWGGAYPVGKQPAQVTEVEVHVDESTSRELALDR